MTYIELTLIIRILQRPELALIDGEKLQLQRRPAVSKLNNSVVSLS